MSTDNPTFTAIRGGRLVSVTQLRGLNGEQGQIILLAGHTTVDDGGQGWFRWEAGVTTGDDGALVIVPNEPRGRWVRVFSGALHATWFGCLPGLGALLPVDSALQDALDAAEGGKLYIPAGVYHTDDTALPRDDTEVYGAGIDKTIFRGTAGAYAGANAVASAQYATLACIGVDNVRIHGLTVDHVTLGTDANGIIAVPTGAEDGGVGVGNGVVCTNIEIHHVKVLLRSGVDTEHNYGIWSVRSEDVDIYKCIVDGGIATLDAASQQEGFEILGGRRVKLWSNKAFNIGNTGFNFTPVLGVENTTINGLQAWSNHAEKCRTLYYLGTCNGAAGAQNLRNVLLTENTGVDGWYYGIWLRTPIAGTTLTNVRIVDNIIDACNEGITVYGILGETGHHGVAVNDNTISGSTTTALGGLTAFNIANLEAKGNTVYLSLGTAIWLQQLIDPDVSDNQVDTCVYEAIVCAGSTRPKITHNRCRRYSNANGERIGIIVTTSTSGLVNDNVMSQAYAHTDIAIADTCDDFQMARNQALHSPTAVSPFVNNCTNPRAA